MAVLPVLSLLCAVFVLSLTTDLSDGCHPGWSGKGSRCFKFFSEGNTWSEAEGECVRHGGHLASIHNRNESQFVGVLAAGQYTWIGGGGSAEARTWYWTDGTEFEYSNWFAGEPNNGIGTYGDGNQHCIQINYGGTGVWDDYACHLQRPFVCAK